MSDLPREVLLQLLDVFGAEAQEHIENITRDMLDMEKGPTAERREQLIENIFREAHSLKGSAGTLGLHDMERVAHAAEDVFGAIKKGAVVLDADLVDAVFAALDALGAMLQRIREDERSPDDEVMSLVGRLIKPLREGGQAPETKKSESAPLAELVAPTKKVEAEPAPKSEPEAEEKHDTELKERREPKDSRREEERVAHRGGERTIRVSMQKLDSFMRQAEEVLLAKIRVDQRLAEVRNLNEQVQTTLREWDRLKDGMRRAAKTWDGPDDMAVQNYIRISGDQLKNSLNRLNVISRNLVNDSQQMQLMNQALQEDLKGLRLTPIGGVFEPFHRMIRDLSKRLDKKIQFEVSGGDIEVDKRIIEEVKDPLVHILRNCVDHGIELPGVRVTTGKPETGSLTLKAEQRGNRLFVEIQDDGRGMDPKKLRATAVKKGLYSKNEAETLSDEDARRLVFLPGFSTASEVTDISGRGVGLDVVKQNLGKLGGLVELDSTVGQGTRFTLSVPLTLATAQGLLVGLHAEVYAIPLNAVERIVRTSPKDIVNIRGRSNLRIDDKLVPLVSLSEVLEIPHQGLSTDKQGMFSAVILGAVEKRVAFAVDSVIEEQEIVTKPLGKPLIRVRNVGGATILGDGSVVILLNPNDLVRIAFGESIRAPTVQENVERVTILVADDTMTTRTLQKSILEMAGFRVLTAKDGEEAYQILATGEPVQVLVSDVQMPRLDGFELTARVRSDNKLKNLPVILVTSLGSDADKVRGIEVGADAYIVKKEYEKGKIIEVIKQLL